MPSIRRPDARLHRVARMPVRNAGKKRTLPGVTERQGHTSVIAEKPFSYPDSERKAVPAIFEQPVRL